MTINEIQDNVIEEFSAFDDWMDKYSLLIDLGNSLPALDERYKTESNLIEGCQSRVWLQADYVDGKIIFQGESDAVIVKGIVSLLISVPKKRFRRAVRRNRAKRQVREAYRHHKHALTAKAEAGNIRLVMAVIWLADTPQTTAEVDAAMAGLLQRLTERL